MEIEWEGYTLMARFLLFYFPFFIIIIFFFFFFFFSSSSSSTTSSSSPSYSFSYLSTSFPFLTLSLLSSFYSPIIFLNPTPTLIPTTDRSSIPNTTKSPWDLWKEMSTHNNTRDGVMMLIK
jgi:hypothetical protein